MPWGSSRAHARSDGCSRKRAGITSRSRCNRRSAVSSLHTVAIPAAQWQSQHCHTAFYGDRAAVGSTQTTSSPPDPLAKILPLLSPPAAQMASKSAVRKPLFAFSFLYSVSSLGRGSPRGVSSLLGTRQSWRKAETTSYGFVPTYIHAKAEEELLHLAPPAGSLQILRGIFRPTECDTDGSRRPRGGGTLLPSSLRDPIPMGLLAELSPFSALRRRSLPEGHSFVRHPEARESPCSSPHSRGDARLHGMPEPVRLCAGRRQNLTTSSVVED